MVLITRATSWPAVARARWGRKLPGHLAKPPAPGDKCGVPRRDEALLDELKALADRLGVKVREEVLLREVGYRVRSGRAVVRGQDVVFLDRHATPAERVEVRLDGLAGRDIEPHYVSPELRRLLEQRGAA
jgi:hypothetical protein